MERKRLGDGLLLIGIVVTVLGVVLTLTQARDDAPSDVSAAPTGEPTATPTRSPATGTPSANLTPTTSAPAATPPVSPTSDEVTEGSTDEPVEAFYPAFNVALAEHDVEFLYGRLAPPVLERYGADQCRTYLDSLPPQDTGLEVIAVTGPAAWNWTSDDVVTAVPDAFTVTLERTVDGQTNPIESHVVRVDGEVRWFTDCGEPL